jgi:hypothetical protein
MVQTSRFEKFLKMVLQLPRLVLEVTLGGRDILLIGVVCFLVVVVAVGSDFNPSGALLLPLLASLIAFDGGFGWCDRATAGGHFPIAQNEGNPNRLLARGMPGGDIKQLLGGVRLITGELLHQGTTHRADSEC